MLELGLNTLLAYLLGSLNGSLVLGKVLGGPDVRSVGSGNAGGTNALRARGKAFALGVMIIDVGKGWLAVALLPGLMPAGVGPGIGAQWVAVACAGAAVVGHCYPVWFGFAGGKGAATAIGALAALAPGLLVAGLGSWLLVAVFTGFVGLSTMIAFCLLPLVVLVNGVAGRIELFAFLVLLAAFIVYTHRGNITRMLRHQENRMTGLMVFRRTR
ncbi:MAG: glycerol-3-phosphate 1-O-acyltransferase PlsY [Gammaproteobacteria bacterium]|nr:glycerol-3-phosphate 1-O-acyltransferase PlsY [Gammaproteobacteria bacterium]